MGAKCAEPDRPVLCFTGDGGIWYHLAELETAVRCGINTVTLVNNNHSLNQERDGVEAIYGGTTAGSDELWRFEDTDFASIAASMGCLGITVTKPGEIAGALERAFAAERPVLIDVKTDIEGIAEIQGCEIGRRLGDPVNGSWKRYNCRAILICSCNAHPR